MSWAEVPFAPSVDSSEPEPEEVGRVEKILAEADEAEYWFAASKDGNRVSHYRGLHNYTDMLRESRPGHSPRPSPRSMHCCMPLFCCSCRAWLRRWYRIIICVNRSVIRSPLVRSSLACRAI